MVARRLEKCGMLLLGAALQWSLQSLLLRSPDLPSKEEPCDQPSAPPATPPLADGVGPGGGQRPDDDDDAAAPAPAGDLGNRRFSGSGHSGSPGRKKKKKAVFAVLTDAQKDTYKSANLMLNALLTRCSAACYGSKMEYHLIFAGLESYVDDGSFGRGNTESILELMTRFGWIIDNHTAEIPRVKSIYKPLFTKQQAEEQQRWWGHLAKQGGRLGDILDRRDGWATYLKFLAWSKSDYERILFIDTDVVFSDNPDSYVDKLPQDAEFLATHEKRYGHDGLNTHMMLITPSSKVFDELMTRAELGEYIPYTNTEQDVIEMLFPPRLAAPRNLKIESLVPHRHLGQASCPQKHKIPPGWRPTNCAEIIRLCNLSHTSKKEAWVKMMKTCV